MVNAFKQQSTEELSSNDNDSNVIEIDNGENSFHEDDDNSMEDSTITSLCQMNQAEEEIRV